MEKRNYATERRRTAGADDEDEILAAALSRPERMERTSSSMSARKTGPDAEDEASDEDTLGA